MPRSAEAKLRRRNRKKADQDAAMDMLGKAGDDDDDDDDDASRDNNNDPEPVEMFPNVTKTDNDDDNLLLPKKSKKKTPIRSTAAGTASRSTPSSAGIKSGLGGIKTTPLILLILMVGTTLLPALIYTGDYVSSFLSKNNVMGAIGFRLGIGSVPNKRVLSFYEKHAPEKLDEVPKILAKHYGQYPTLIKKLERKYQDYGYFIGWEDDESPKRLALEKIRETYDIWLQRYWNRYAPQPLKTGARNIRYNLTFLLKKFKKAWKKYIWPQLEPIFGVPDGAEKQKRQDAADFKARNKQKRKASSSTTGRRRNRDFRDDEEEE